MLDRHPLQAVDSPCDMAAEPPLTATTARALISGCSDLSERCRRDLLSAVNTVVRVTGLPADLVVLTPAALQAGFLGRSAAACGLTRGSKANVTSRLRQVLALAGVIEAETMPIAESWVRPLGRLPEHGRRGLMRLARFCSARKIAPADVSEATFAAFRQHVMEQVLIARPHDLLATARRAWNHACRAGTGWPGRELARRIRQHDYVQPLSAFAAAFQADLAAFGERLAGTLFEDPFADMAGEAGRMAAMSPPRPLKPTTVALRLDHCRWAASAVVASGVPIAEITSLAGLVIPVQRAANALRFLYERAAKANGRADGPTRSGAKVQGKASAASMHVAEVLLMIAKHVAVLPAGDINKLRPCGRNP